MKRIASRLSWILCAILILAALPARGETPAMDAARRIADSSGLSGGVCSILGDSNAQLALAISEQGPFVVQALYRDASTLQAARAAIRSQDKYGPVSADFTDGQHLPYCENLVNLIIVQAMADSRPDGPWPAPSPVELFRVLSPLGSVYFRGADSNAAARQALSADLRSAGFSTPELVDDEGHWLRFVKPWPADIDQWTHFLHGADGNPVAEDLVVGPPQRYQWISGPTWLRSHESDSSVKTLVSSGGRLFTIEDEGPISLVGPQSPPDKWTLTARDAFNGLTLWKVPIEDWGWRSWKPSWFTPRPGDIPLNIQKRLVAVDGKLYVTLGFHAPVSQLDARTGRVLQAYEGTHNTAEILYQEGSLILTVLEDDRARVTAVDAESGELLWQSDEAFVGTTTDYYRFTAMRGSVPPADVDPTLNTATDGRVVALLDGGDVVGLDFNSGDQKWRTPFPLVDADRKAGNIDAQGHVWVGTLIVSDGVVLHASPNQLAAFSADSGEILWSQPKKYLGHLWYEWKDVFVIDGLVWTWSAQVTREKLESRNSQAAGFSSWPTSANGYHLHSGQLAKSVPLGNLFKTNHHHRCYRNKATSRYILASRRGSEFVDLQQGEHTFDNWIRGTCHMGMTPANGLQYATPHPCSCYIDEKLNGFNAVASAAASDPRTDLPEPLAASRLEQGPAYGQPGGPATAADDWPTFRGDSMRSGSVQTSVTPSPKLLWRVEAGNKPAGPIAVGDRVFVPLVDEHHLVALDANDGKRLWEFAAGGRIDSPPTYYQGTLIFGSADGWVYSVRADDGKLVWRFQAALEDRQIGAMGQLESAWPVHGGVLVLGDTAYLAAGRTSYLDGGIRLYALDAASGKPLHSSSLDGPHYEAGEISQNFQLPMGSLTDVLQGSQQGENTLIYMRRRTFNRRLEERVVPPREAVQRISALGGMLDDSYFKRIPWSFGRGKGHARLVAHDDRAVYAVRMFDSMQGLDPSVFFTPASKGYLLFATERDSTKQIWSGRIRVRINAMVATENLLFVAGPPDVVDPEDPLGAFEGRKGGVLAAMDCQTGRQVWKATLPSPPVFNGMAAAGGRLYVSMQDGQVACFGP